MNQYNSQEDPLKLLFEQLPKEQLPTSFRSTMMQQVIVESARMKEKSERLMMAAVVIASLIMLALGVLAILYLEVSWEWFCLPKFSSVVTVSFWGYILVLSLLLLLADYKLRQLYKRKHRKKL